MLVPRYWYVLFLIFPFRTMRILYQNVTAFQLDHQETQSHIQSLLPTFWFQGRHPVSVTNWKSVKLGTRPTSEYGYRVRPLLQLPQQKSGFIPTAEQSNLSMPETHPGSFIKNYRFPGLIPTRLVPKCLS